MKSSRRASPRLAMLAMLLSLGLAACSYFDTPATSSSDVAPDGTVAADVAPDGTVAADVAPDGTVAADVGADGTTASDTAADGTTASDVAADGTTASDTAADGTTASDVAADDGQETEAGSDGDSGGGGDFALRLNGGLESGTSTFDGKEFLPLLPYLTSGEAFDSATDGLGKAIGGTVFDELYQIETYVKPTGDHATFTIPVEAGDYTVHLHFVDWVELTVVGSRVFNVDLQGQQVLSNLDIVSQVGHSTALIKSFDIGNVQDSVTVTLRVVKGYPEIAAIEIVPQGQPYLGEGIEEPTCGDGEVAAGIEECDDGETDSCAGTCNATCTGPANTCGDGYILCGEGCDDGNSAGGDGCSTACGVEQGWVCTGEPSDCVQSTTSSSSQMTTDRIWRDSYFGPEDQPCAHNQDAYYYLQGDATTMSPSFVPSINVVDTSWVASNVYLEICNGAINNASCSFTNNDDENIAIEVAGMSYYWYDGTWHTLFEGERPSSAYAKQPPSVDPYRHCTDQSIMNWVDEHRNDNKQVLVNGHHLYFTTGGSFPHPWSSQVHFPNGSPAPLSGAVMAQLFARLVDKTTGLPIVHTDNVYVTYAGTDSKTAAGMNDWAMSVQGHFRRINQDGSWTPFGVLAGFATQAEFEATNPPLASTPPQ